MGDRAARPGLSGLRAYFARMSYSHVLAATDFSDLGEEAVVRAAAIATAMHARLTVLHVVDAPPGLNSAFALYTVNVSESDREAALARVRDALERQLEALPQVPAARTVIARSGHPRDEILELARSAHVDLIVLGTHGRHGVSRMLMGSVAEQVVRLGPCDVLAVRARATR